jgi:hypothetical protein
MEHPVGRAIALDRRRAEIEELPALPGAPEADLLALRLDRDAAERILEPERDQNAGPVGADLDAGADLAQRRRLLEDGDVEAATQQRERGGETADPGTDDEDARRSGQDAALALSRITKL